MIRSWKTLLGFLWLLGFILTPFAWGDGSTWTMPYNSGSISSTSSLFTLTQTGTGWAGYFEINNTNNTRPVLHLQSNGRGYALLSQVASATGKAGLFFINNSSNPNEALYVCTLGTGWAGYFQISNTANSRPAIEARTNGTGPALYAVASSGLAGNFVGAVRMTGFQLPTGAAAGYVLTSDGSGRGSWQPISLAGITAGGDLSGSYPNPTVARLQGRSVSSATPANGQVLKWNGSAWTPADDLRDAFWQASGSAVFYNGGNVGIGTNAPAARLSLGAGDANTKLALWQGTAAGEVMGFGIAPNQFRLHLHNPSNRFSFLNAPNGSELMTILGNGNVGIGATNPQARLHVVGDAYFTSGTTTLQILPGRLFGSSQPNAATLEIPGNGTIGVWDSLSVTGNLHVGGNRITVGGGTDSSWSRVSIGLNDVGGSLYTGYVRVDGANGNPNVRITSVAGYPNHGSVAVHDANGTDRAQMYVHQYSTGLVRGRIVAEEKYFRVPDPDDPTLDIWYGCIEGPELAMYVRGTAWLVNGRAYIELPDHFRKLADEQGMTVQLTPLSPASKGLCVLRKRLDGIEVAELMNGTGNYEFDWEVKAVRKEHRDFRVYRPWDEVLTAGEDLGKAWEARLKSIQDRQAVQTPNPR